MAAGPGIDTVMTAVQTALKTIQGLRTSDIHPDTITPPMAVVGIPTVTAYHETSNRGVMRIEATVAVYVSSALDRAGQQLLAKYASPGGSKSVINAIEADRTLGSVVQDCVVMDFRPLGLDEINAIGYYGGAFRLQILANGKGS